MDKTLDLSGQHILITGVSRPLGIGAQLAKRLAESGAIVAIHGFSDYDMEVGHRSATPNGTEITAKQLSDLGLHVIPITSSDLEVKGNAEQVVKEASAKLHGLDGLVLNHAYSTIASLGTWTPEHIDSHLQVNVRASMMMIQAFVDQVDSSKSNTITLFTSGQYLGPMTSEIAYCVSKEAIICLTKQTAYAVSDKNIRVNCINPGPNDTGYSSGKEYEMVANMFPTGRWGTPDDAADLVLFLHSSYPAWITGQVIASEGGFRRF